MKKTIAMMIALLFALAMLPALATQPALAEPEQADEAYTDVAILSTTDMHGKCWDTNLLTLSAENNNMLRVSTAVNRIRAEFGPENVLLIDNGDLFQGTPVSQAQLFQYFVGDSDLPPAMALCLAEIGYDAFVLGNHEFNYEWRGMSAVYDWMEDSGVPVLAANVYYDGSDGVHGAGENVFTPYVVKTIAVNGHDHKIGILGMENTDITRWDLPVNYPGLQFVSPGNDEWLISSEAQKYLDQMKAEGCEFIIASYHSGLGSADEAVTFGVNSESQGLRLIRKTDDIALLILGHDHSAAYSNTYEANASGEPVLVVNGGGQELTKSVFRFSEDTSGALIWTIVDTKNLKLGDFEADEALRSELQPYVDIAEAEVNLPAGKAAGDWDLSNDYYTEQTDTVDLISAAQIAGTTQRIKEKYGLTVPEAFGQTGLEHLDVDMAMTSVPTVNGYVVQPGDISVRDVYKLYRFANNLLVLPMTGTQIKAVMEENASNRLKVRVHDGEAFVYTQGDQFTNIVFGGVNFTYDMSMPAGERVEITSFHNGRDFYEDEVYLVVVNNYILGNERCGLRDYGADDAIWSQMTDAEGEVVQDIITEYIRQRTSENGAVTPEDFDWHWQVVYGADASELPAFEGTVGATLTALPEDGHRYVIYNEAQGCMLTARPTNGGLDAAACPAVGAVLPAPLPEEAEVFTAHAMEDGSYQFSDAEGQYLVSAPKGGLMIQPMPQDESLSRWRLEPAYGGWYFVNAGATGQLALEYYSERFTTYYLGKSGNYVFNVYEVKDDSPASQPTSISCANGIPTLVLTIDETEFQNVIDSIDHSYSAETGSIKIYMPDGYVSEYTGDELVDSEDMSLEYIRGRGNSSWVFEKKPFKIKLDKSQNLLGMGTNKHWVLLANAFDDSLMRNRLVGYMGRALGLDYTPQYVPVDFYVNEQYYGSYLLAQQVRIHETRVDIPELTADDNEEPAVTGGYLLSLNLDDGGSDIIETNRGMKFQSENPSFAPGETGTAAQREYISNFLQETEDAIFSDTNPDPSDIDSACAEYMDLRSAARYWWVQELTRNVDAYKTTSTYLYKDRDGKLCWGPLWDFDFSCAGDASGISSRMEWLNWMRYFDYAFQQELLVGWKDYQAILAGITAEDGILDQYAAEIEQSWKADYLLWNPDVDPQDTEAVDAAFARAVSKLRNFFNARSAWFNENLDKLYGTYYSVTFKGEGKEDVTKYYKSGEDIDVTSILKDEFQRDGYLFLGWTDEEGNMLYDYVELTENRVFTAKYLSETEATLPNGLYFPAQTEWCRLESNYFYLGNHYMITPEEVDNSTIQWTSSDESIASIDGNFIEFHEAGTVIITGTARSGVSNSFTLHIVNGDVDDVIEDFDFAEETMTLKPGEFGQNSITVTPDDKPTNTWMNYSSSDDTVATVNSIGVVEAKAEGVCTITAKDNFSEVEKVYTLIVSKDKHIMTAHPAVAATCTKAGNTAYWFCEECGKYFADEQGTQEIEEGSWVVEPEGHTWKTWQVKTGILGTKANAKISVCTKCKRAVRVTTQVVRVDRPIGKIPRRLPVLTFFGQRMELSLEDVQGQG